MSMENRTIHINIHLLQCYIHQFFLKITSLATFLSFPSLPSAPFCQEGSSCAICLDKSDANEAVPWVQLPCEHVLHRKCFQELVSFLGIEG